MQGWIISIGKEFDKFSHKGVKSAARCMAVHSHKYTVGGTLLMREFKSEDVTGIDLGETSHEALL